MTVKLRPLRQSRTQLRSTRAGARMLVHPKGLQENALSDFIRWCPTEPGYTVVAVEVPPKTAPEALEDVLEDLAACPGVLRLIPSRLGSDSTLEFGNWLAQRLGRTVVAHQGTVMIVPGGGLYVPPGEQDVGWLRFDPGTAPVPHSRRFPRPSWDCEPFAEPRELGPYATLEPLPAGAWIRPAVETPDVLAFRRWLIGSVAVDPLLPRVVLGYPGSPMPTIAAVAEFWRSLPVALQPGVRFAGFGGTDEGMTPYGQQLADALDAPVVLGNGVQLAGPSPAGGNEMRTVLRHGVMSWSPFVGDLGYLPVRSTGGVPTDPVAIGHRAPIAGLQEREPGVYEYSHDAVLEVTQSGLWMRSPVLPDDSFHVRTEHPDPAHVMVVFDASTNADTHRMQLLATEMVERLEPRVRSVARILASTATGAARRIQVDASLAVLDTQSQTPAAPDPSSLDVSSLDASSLSASGPDVSSLSASGPDVSNPDAENLNASIPDVTALAANPEQHPGPLVIPGADPEDMAAGMATLHVPIATLLASLRADAQSGSHPGRPPAGSALVSEGMPNWPEEPVPPAVALYALSWPAQSDADVTDVKEAEADLVSRTVAEVRREQAARAVAVGEPAQTLPPAVEDEDRVEVEDEIAMVADAVTTDPAPPARPALVSDSDSAIPADPAAVPEIAAADAPRTVSAPEPADTPLMTAAPAVVDEPRIAPTPPPTNAPTPPPADAPPARFTPSPADAAPVQPAPDLVDAPPTRFTPSPADIALAQPAPGPVDAPPAQFTSSPADVAPVQPAPSPVETPRVEFRPSPADVVPVRPAPSPVETPRVESTSDPVDAAPVQPVSGPVDAALVQPAPVLVDAPPAQFTPSPADVAPVQPTPSPVDAAPVQPAPAAAPAAQFTVARRRPRKGRAIPAASAAERGTDAEPQDTNVVDASPRIPDAPKTAAPAADAPTTPAPTVPLQTAASPIPAEFVPNAVPAAVQPEPPTPAPAPVSAPVAQTPTAPQAPTTAPAPTVPPVQIPAPVAQVVAAPQAPTAPPAPQPDVEPEKPTPPAPQPVEELDQPTPLARQPVEEPDQPTSPVRQPVEEPDEPIQYGSFQLVSSSADLSFGAPSAPAAPAPEKPRPVVPPAPAAWTAPPAPAPTGPVTPPPAPPIGNAPTAPVPPSPQNQAPVAPALRPMQPQPQPLRMQPAQPQPLQMQPAQPPAPAPPSVPAPAATPAAAPGPAPAPAPTAPVQPQPQPQFIENAPSVPAAQPVTSAAASAKRRPAARPVKSTIRVQPVPTAQCSVLPRDGGLAKERDWLRRNLSKQYDATASSVARILSEYPGLRAGSSASDTEVLTDLVALRLYLTGKIGGLDEAVRAAKVGPHVPLARCVAAGLRRLPSYRGPLRTRAPLSDEQVRWYGARSLVTEWSFLPAIASAGLELPGTAEILIWSMSARRTGLLDPSRLDQVVFPPGTSFKVLSVGDGDGGPEIRLRELTRTEIAADGTVQSMPALDEFAVAALEEAGKAWRQEDPVERLPADRKDWFASAPGLLAPAASAGAAGPARKGQNA
jgi:hypothetical protein